MSTAATNSQKPLGPPPGWRHRCQFLKFVLFFPLILLFGLISACRPAPPVVKIGLVGPFEGQHRAIGYDAIYSARLAVRETNLNGGIGPYRLSLVALDDGGDPDLAREVAASLVEDQAVVAVVGHWLPQTTAAAGPVYQTAELPLVPAGDPPFGAVTDPQTLPAEFLADYASVTPFDEVAGPYAAPAYDAFYLLVKAIETLEADGRPVNRETMTAALHDLQYDGLGGTVYLP